MLSPPHHQQQMLLDEDGIRMAAKKHDMDVEHTLKQIRAFWPKFPINKENLTNPTSDFVIRFYKAFVSEINDKLSFITNEELTDSEFVENQEVGQEIQLYCQILKIYRKLNYTPTTFSLVDLYNPQPKRTYSLLKMSVHFLIFVNNNVDAISKITHSLEQKLAETRDLRSLKQQLIQNTAENSEILVRVKDINASLRKKLKTLESTKYEGMLRDKAESEKIYLEKTNERKHLNSEIDGLDYELQHLEGKVQELQQRLVTAEDFQNLKKREKYVELEAKEMCSEDGDVDSDVNKEREMSEHLQECAKSLETIDFSSIQVKILSELEAKWKLQQNIQEKYRKENKLLDDTATAKAASLDKKVQTLKEYQTIYSDLFLKAAEEAKNHEICYQRKVDDYELLFKQSEKLRVDIVQLQKEISDTQEASKQFAKEAQKYIQIMLKADADASTKFYQTLLHLNSLK